MTHSSAVEFEVPNEETPQARCPYCERPFAAERVCTLHLVAHQDEWTDAEQSAYEDAYESETDELFIYHLKVVALLVFVFFTFMYTYVFVWT